MDSIAINHLQAAGFRKFVPVVIDQGDTGAASRIHIEARDLAGVVASAHAGPLRVRICDEGTYDAATNATIAAAAGSALLEELTEDVDLVLSEIRAAYAAGTLTLTGVAKHGETVTIGSRVYEFRSNSVAATAPRVTVNIASNTVAAQGTLTLAAQPTAGDSMTIGTRSYLFVASGTADNPGEISIGADLAAAKLNVVAAINGTDGFNTANSLVTAAAFSSNDCVLTAIIKGTAGNAYVTTENFTSGSNVFDAATLGTTTAGTDCSAANAITALVTAITADSSAVVTVVDGAGDTLVATAKVAGTAANAYATTETMANASWGGSTLTGGVAAVPGTYALDLTDATAETVTLRVGPAPIGAGFGDFSSTLDVEHAAP